VANPYQNFQFEVPQGIDFMAVAPILVVIVTGILALIVEMIAPKRNNDRVVAVSLLGLALAGALTYLQIGEDPVLTLQSMFLKDRFGVVMQLLLILACFLSVLFSEGYLRQKKAPFGEFYPLVLWSTAGAMLMVTTKNLLVVFVGLELLSVSLYVMAGLSRRENKSEESALKYFLLGAFASAFLLYGIALFYGATGSLSIDMLAPAWENGSETARNLILVGLGFTFIGLFFKAAFVPFHQWTPDVYQGAPTNVTAFMAAGSKIAAIAVLYRVLDAAMPLSEYWIPVLFWVAILTMTVGNLLAFVQKDVKRILAYSSIAHAGYILVALVAHAKMPESIHFSTIAYYLLAYSLMTIGAFAVVSLAAKDGKEGTKLEDLHGLWQRAPFAAGTLIVFVASLIGIPPTAGFVGKLQIFIDALNANLVALAIVLAVNSIVSVGYYLAIAKAVFVADKDAEQVSAKPGVGLISACAACALGVVLAGVFVKPIVDGWFSTASDLTAVTNTDSKPEPPKPAKPPQPEGTVGTVGASGGG
jgi:NADH-quinone oxidoreductase subunit N